MMRSAFDHKISINARSQEKLDDLALGRAAGIGLGCVAWIRVNIRAELVDYNQRLYLVHGVPESTQWLKKASESSSC